MDATTADVIKFLGTLTIGPIGIWFGSQLQSRQRTQEHDREDLKNAQTHFRQYCILEGFENGLTRLMLLREHFIKEHTPGATHTTDFDLPVAPFLRIYDVIGCKDIATVIVSFRALGQGYRLGIPSKSTDTELTLIDGLSNEVFRAKEILLTHSYTSKPDIERIRQIPEIKNIKGKIEELANKLHEIHQSRYGNGFL